MNIRQIVVVAIIAMFLIVPFASAKQESVDVGTVKQDKKIEEKAVDKTKESAKEIKNKDKEITGKITVTDSDTSAYEISKESDSAIKIKKNEADGQHTKAKVTIPKEELQKIDEDGDKLYGVLHIADDGSTTHDVYTESQLTSGVEMVFSENIVNGYSGYWEKTQTGVTSGTTIDIPDVSGSNYYITTSVNGTVPTYTAGIPTTGLVAKYTMENISGSTLIDNSPAHNNGTIVNATQITGWHGQHAMYFNGKSRVGFNPGNSTEYTLYAEINTTTTTAYRRVITLQRTSTLSKAYMFISPANREGTNVYNGTSYEPIVSSSTATGIRAVAWTINSTSQQLYRNGVQTATATLKSPMDPSYYPNANIGNGAGIGYTDGFVGTMDNIYVYTIKHNTANLLQMYAGGSGISIKPVNGYNFTGYNVASGVEKIIDTDATCTGLEYIDTTGGTHTVTVRIYFTEDITKTTETKGAVYQNISIIHTKQNATASVGTITYELDPLYSGTPVLSSNNTNATVSRNDTHAIISTGLIKQGQSFSYAVSVPDDHDHGIHIGEIMEWVGTGWDFAGVAPEDWTNYIGDEVRVIIS